MLKYQASFHKVWDAHKSGDAQFLVSATQQASMNDYAAMVRSGEMAYEDAESRIEPQYDVFKYTTLVVLKTGLRFLVEFPEMLDRAGKVGEWSCRLPAPRVCVELRRKIKDGTRATVWLFAVELEEMPDVLREGMIKEGLQVPSRHIQITLVADVKGEITVLPAGYILCWIDGKPAILKLKLADGPPDEIVDYFANSFAGYIETLLRFLNLINCRGVTYRPVAPLLRRSPKRRANRSGKRYVYHVVDALMKPVGAYGPGTGTRQRFHLRRGNIRTYQSGDAIWIDSYFAGDAEIGVVVKDYELKPIETKK